MQRLFLLSPRIVKLGMEADNKSLEITSSDSFNLFSARLNKPRGWIFAETPFSAISRSNWSPESAEVRPLFKAPREDGSWFPGGLTGQFMDRKNQMKMKTKMTPMKLSLKLLASLVSAGIFSLTAARPTFATSPDYIVTTTTGATIVPGTTDTGNHTDDGSTGVALPFDVQFYDQTFSAGNFVYVNSNGFLQCDTTTWHIVLRDNRQARSHSGISLVIPQARAFGTTNLNQRTLPS
jgi:hypothetical protein